LCISLILIYLKADFKKTQIIENSLDDSKKFLKKRGGELFGEGSEQNERKT